MLKSTETLPSPEARVTEFIASARYAEAPLEAQNVVIQILQTVIGTAVAGANNDGIHQLRNHLVMQGGTGEAHTIIFGDLLPARNAALLNATMARALDYCDTMVPGLHLGSSVVIAALVAAEVHGGCTGSELMDGLTVGLEVGAHLNLTEEQYDGFDPTGVAGILGATAAAARILKLGRVEIQNAMGIAFNRGSGSFQANVDASLAVRLIQGFTASNAIESVQLAKLGLSGPSNYLSGRFGYAHLWGRDRSIAESMVDNLGVSWHILKTFFKKYPCCGLAQGPTESILAAIEETELTADQVDQIDLYLPEFAFSLIGSAFSPGENPRVNAQFSAEYCIANALIRREASLSHFESNAVEELDGHPIFDRIKVHHDPKLTGHSASRTVIKRYDGSMWTRHLEIGPGYPGNPLTREENESSFNNCLNYAPYALNTSQIDGLNRLRRDVHDMTDTRLLVSYILSENAPSRMG